MKNALPQIICTRALDVYGRVLVKKQATPSADQREARLIS